MVEHTTLINNGDFTSGSSSPSTFISALKAILSAYSWESGSTVNEGSSLGTTCGIYYFTNDSYIKIDYFADSTSFLGINLVTPNGTKRIGFVSNGYCTISVGKTSKGICICAYSGASGSRANPRFYNLYVGDITTLDGTTTKGCIYIADDNSYTAATDSGISSEATFSSTIDSTRKAYLIPVTDSTHGYTFKNIFMMKNAPLNYNAMKIEDTQKIYLCGKAICLED